MHRPGNRIIPGLRPATRPHHPAPPTPPAPVLDALPAGWHTAFAQRLHGLLDPAALLAALGAVAARQDALRYRIVHGTGVVDPPGPVPVAVVDLAGAPASRLDRCLAEFAAAPLEPAERLWHAALYRLDAEDHVLAFAGHRAVFDDRTPALLAAELAAAYPGAAAPPPVPGSFASYVAWRAQRDSRTDPAWWAAHLDGVPHPLALPADAPPTDRNTDAPTTGQTGDEPTTGQRPAGQATLLVDAADSAGIGALARGLGTPPAAVLLAALGVVLGRFTGHRDLVVGTPIVGPRSPVFEPLLGSLAEIAPLRLLPDPETAFATQVLRARDELLEALAHPTVGPVPAGGVQVLVETADAGAPTLDLPGLAAVPIPVPTPTPVELTLRAVPEGDRLRLTVAYHTDRYRPERIAALLATLRHVLAQAVAAPGRPAGEFALRPDDQPAPDRDETVVDRQGRRAAVGELGEVVARWAGGWLGTGRPGRYRPDGTVEPAAVPAPQAADSVRALETGLR